MEDLQESVLPKFADSLLYVPYSSASSSFVSSSSFHEGPLCVGVSTPSQKQQKFPAETNIKPLALKFATDIHKSLECEGDSVPERHSLGKEVLPPPGFGSITSVVTSASDANIAPAVVLPLTSVAPMSTSVAAVPIDVALHQTSSTPQLLSADQLLSYFNPPPSCMSQQSSLAPPEFSVASPESSLAPLSFFIAPPTFSVASSPRLSLMEDRLSLMEDLRCNPTTERKGIGSQQLDSQTNSLWKHDITDTQMHLQETTTSRCSLPWFSVAPPWNSVAPSLTSVAPPWTFVAPSLKLSLAEAPWSTTATENKETGSIQAEVQLLQHLSSRNSLLQINSKDDWNKPRNTDSVFLLKSTSPLTMANQETGTESSLLITTNQEKGAGSSLLTTANQEKGTGSSLLTTNQKPAKSERYKTELCREFTEKGSCRYGEKCQFAHGEHERRSVPRHAKYKTKRCRTYHSTGFCDYGKRCDFIHEENQLERDTRPSSNQRHNMGENVGPMSGKTFDSIFGMNLDLRLAFRWDQSLEMNLDHKLDVNSDLVEEILDQGARHSLDLGTGRNMTPGVGPNQDLRIGLNFNRANALSLQAVAERNSGPKTWPFSKGTVLSSHPVNRLDIDGWVALSSEQKLRQTNQCIFLGRNTETPSFGHSSGFTDVDPTQLSGGMLKDNKVALQQPSSKFSRFEDWPALGQSCLSSVLPLALPPVVQTKPFASSVSPLDETNPLHVHSWDLPKDSTAVSLKQSHPQNASPSHMSVASTSNIWSSLFHYPRGWTLS